MPLSITIDEAHPKFAAIMSLLSGTSTGALSAADVNSMPQPGAAPAPIPMPAVGGGDGDDDTGPVNANAPALDSTGLPWDERIHAGTKTLKSDGTWTGKRGGPKGAELDAIVAELRARAGANQPAPIPMPAIQPAAAPVPMPAIAMPAVQAMQPAPTPMPAPVPAVTLPQSAPIPMPAPEAAPAPVAAAIPQADPATVATVAQATGTLDFQQFMQHLSAQMSKRDAAGAPLVHAEYLAAITKEISDAFAPHGFAPLTAITDISSNPQMIVYATQLMQRDQRW
jgi:hypothetical protein